MSAQTTREQFDSCTDEELELIKRLVAAEAARAKAATEAVDFRFLPLTVRAPMKDRYGVLRDLSDNKLWFWA